MGYPVRVALIDDHALFREGLRSVLEHYPEFELVGEADNARAGYDLLERTSPDVVLLDVRLPGTDGVAAAREIRRRFSTVRVLMLSAFDEADIVSDALQAGALGYLLKAEPMAECVEGLRAVSHGRTYLAAKISPAAGEQHRRLQRSRDDSSDGSSSFQLLSKREKEVFHLLVRGLSNAKVARELCISVKTVESHREHILRKLGLHSIVELVRYAARNGLLAEGRGP